MQALNSLSRTRGGEKTTKHHGRRLAARLVGGDDGDSRCLRESRNVERLSAYGLFSLVDVSGLRQSVWPDAAERHLAKRDVGYFLP